MAPIAASTLSRGGLAATFELYEGGFTRNDIRRAVSRGALLRVRQGWYAPPGIQPELIQAARVGGRLTCLSGIRSHGLWTYPTTSLHVAVTEHACRLRQPTDMRKRLDRSAAVRTHWRQDEPSGSRLLLDPVECLSDLLRCQHPEVAISAADSALHQGVVALPQWLGLLAQLPKALVRLLPAPDARSESGIESLTRIRLAKYRLPIRSQVNIPGVGRVDFLIGERLVVEVDGAEYHTDPVQFEADRRRDAVLSRLNYRVLRFSYRQVMFRWHEVEAAVLAAVIRGDHH